MIYDICTDGAPILAERLSAFDFASGVDLDALLIDMIETMEANKGIGLAANQIGLRHRLFTMRHEGETIMCINPEVVTEEGLETETEGCLSFPDLRFDVRRPDAISVRYNDRAGAEVETTFSGISARVFQHELDHINGIVFTSRVSKLKLQMAKARRDKIARMTTSS